VAPEVAVGSSPTPASDVYAVGALAWWCVTGAAPAPPALRRADEQLPPGLPQSWCEVTRRALSGDPAVRPGAAELALAYFDAAPCEALRLVVGSDESSLLTQRLRHAAEPLGPPSRSGAADPDRSPTRWRDLVVGGPGRGRWAARLDDRRRALLVLTALCLAAALGSVALWWDARGADPDHRVVRIVPVAEGATSARPGGGAPSVTLPDLSADLLAPQRDPRGLMQALADRRASVVTTGDRAGLSLLDVPGSPAMAADTKLLEDLRAAGESYDGVGLLVRTSRVVTSVSSPGGRQQDMVAVEAAVDTTAYTLIGVSGTRQARPALRGAEMRFDLRWVDGRWLIERVTAAAAG